jgi:uncharacterized protein YbbK (DUF523 family)
MIRVLVSGCLLGDRVRYNGGDSAASSGILERWRSEGRIVQFCPEVGGASASLGLPRKSRARAC